MVTLFTHPFFSARLYRDVAHRWSGFAIGTLCLFVLLHSMAYVIAMHHSYKAFMRSDGAVMLSQIPDITVISGQLRINQSWPHYIKDAKGRVWVQFDATYNESQFGTNQIWITATDIYIRPAYGDVHRFSLSSVKDLSLTQKQIRDAFTSLQKQFLLYLLPVLLVLFMIYRLLQVAVLSLWGKFLNRILGVFLTVPQIIRLTVVAMIPVLLIDAGLLLAGYGSWDWPSLILLTGGTYFDVFSPPLLYMAINLCLDPVGWPWWSFFLFTGYMIFALKANRALIR